MNRLVLGDSLDALLDHRGKTPKKLGGDFAPSGVPVASALLVRDGRLDLSEARYVSDEMHAKWMPERTRRGDVILTSEAPAGRVARVDTDDPLVLGQRLFCLRGKAGVLDSGFLYYALQSHAVQTSILGHSTGTTVVGIRQSALRLVQIPAPSFPEQQAIAEVLGALDDKIAANTALAERAESLASLTYDAAVTAWPRVPMNTMLEPILGGTPPRARDDYWSDGDQLWISARDITSAPNRVVLDTAEKITLHAVSDTKAKALPTGSVILTARGTVGEVGRLARPASFNQSCYGFRPDSLPPGLLYFSILRATQRAKAVAHGSVFDTITKATFGHLDMAWDESRAALAEEAIAPILDVVSATASENRTLAATRDALLPQLMSGKLRVRDAEDLIVQAGV